MLDATKTRDRSVEGLFRPLRTVHLVSCWNLTSSPYNTCPGVAFWSNAVFAADAVYSELAEFAELFACAQVSVVLAASQQVTGGNARHTREQDAGQ